MPSGSLKEAVEDKVHDAVCGLGWCIHILRDPHLPLLLEGISRGDLAGLIYARQSGHPQLNQVTSSNCCYLPLMLYYVVVVGLNALFDTISMAGCNPIPPPAAHIPKPTMNKRKLPQPVRVLALEPGLPVPGLDINAPWGLWAYWYWWIGGAAGRVIGATCNSIVGYECHVSSCIHFISGWCDAVAQCGSNSVQHEQRFQCLDDDEFIVDQLSTVMPTIRNAWIMGFHQH